MIELVNHIKEINEVSKKEMANNSDIWIGMIVEDPEHWSDYGITTPAEFDRYQNEQCLYEVVSSKYSKSFARSIGISSMSDEELAAELDSYGSYSTTELEKT